MSIQKTLLSLLAIFSVHSAEAKLVTQAVAYSQAGVQLEGYLSYDDEKTTPGKTPGVLLVHEWWGLNDYVKGRADEIARMGYVAFAADMYGKGKVTDDAKQAGEWAGEFYGKPLMAERAKAGLDQLTKVAAVDATKVAAIGFCFGGSTCQTLAYSGVQLAGIVSFHGGPIPAPKDVTGKIKTRFLLLNGAVDPMVKPGERADLEESLEAAKIDYESIDYAGALHAFTNPGADAMAVKNDLAGKIGYSKSAATRSWKQMQAFFIEIFGEPQK